MTKPIKCISVVEAKNLQNKWKETRAQEIEQAQGYEDTREFLYSLDELQEYLNYVKEQSNAQGIDKPGIRIYIGAYPKTSTQKSYATLFLAPTKDLFHSFEGLDELEIANKTENNYEIEPFNIVLGGYPPKDY